MRRMRMGVVVEERGMRGGRRVGRGKGGGRGRGLRGERESVCSFFWNTMIVFLGLVYVYNWLVPAAFGG